LAYIFDGFAAWGIRQHSIYSVYLWVFTISKFERLLLRVISTSDIWKHFRQCSVCDCGKRFGISIQRLYTELEKNIDASRANFVDKLLSGAINNTSRSLARNFGTKSYC
jgi:hypothetical protein